MSVRNILLAVGVLSLLGSLALSVFWLRQVRQPVASQPQPIAQAIVVAARALPEGAVLASGDMTWKDVSERAVRAGNLVRGQVSENEFVGAVTRRAFMAGEPLIASDLVKADDKQFLAAVLKPGMRAIAIAVDAQQSISGLMQPGDRVNVILTHSLRDAKERPEQTVAETVLRDVRVIAVDQSLGPAAKLGSQVRGAITGEARPVPKAVTLEVTEQQAEKLAVALELGRLRFVIRSLATGRGGAAGQPMSSTWGTGVSPALGEAGTPQSEAEKSIRVPPARLQ